jgi:hypothetical protein
MIFDLQAFPGRIIKHPVRDALSVEKQFQEAPDIFDPK